MIRFKQFSEELYSNCLDSLGLFWDYEKTWGTKKPDFTIYSDQEKKNIVAITEIEDIVFSEHETNLLKSGQMVFRSGNPYLKIREKINTAREQLKFCKDYPCILIINDRTSPSMPTAIFFGAMLGDLTFSFPVRSKDNVDQPEAFEFFGPNGKMIDPKSGRDQNTTITALGYIQTIRPDAITSAFNKQSEELSKEVKDLNDQVQLKHYFQEIENLKRKKKSEGFDLEKEVVSANFILNPFSRKEFPKRYFSKKYSYISEYEPKNSKINLIYDWSK